MKGGAFESCHPIVLFVYFVLVLACTMVLMHPVCLGISLLCGTSYAVLLRGREAVLRGALYLLPMTLLAAILNPLFNHRGVTILGYLPGGNPLTLESILYGGAAAVMLAAVVCWFSCCSTVLTSDKLICLFGSGVPVLSLLLSMVLRFVPAFRIRLKAIADAQRCIGRDVTGGNLLSRAKNGAHILSILVTWALENAVHTADSMKSRGYGLPGRTAFSIYRFDERDWIMLCLILCAAGFVLAGGVTGSLYWRYFPTAALGEITPGGAAALTGYAVLCAVPLMLELWEARKWNASRWRG